MFTAICSRKHGRPITADEAYRMVWKSSDWGYFQAIDGWVCPECKQPVFLKGPHERVTKLYSFAVQAHFCHHSAKAAADCTLYADGGKPGNGQSDQIHQDRGQSLARFFAEYPEMTRFLASLLSTEEELLRGAAGDIGIREPEYMQLTQSNDFDGRVNVDMSAQSIYARLEGVDSFLAGVHVLGASHKNRIPNSFLAVKGRKNSLRRTFLQFGKNRKHYFQLLRDSGLMQEHDAVAARLVSQVATAFSKAKRESRATYWGVITKNLDNILREVGLLELGEPPCSYVQYLHALPFLGDRFPDFAHLVPGVPVVDSGCSTSVPSRPKPLPPIRITSSRRLLVENRVIKDLEYQGSKPNGATLFLRPCGNEDRNSYVVIPGDGCILLTSTMYATPGWRGAPWPLSAAIIQADPGLPEMLWDARITLSCKSMDATGVFIQKENLQILQRSIIAAFGGDVVWPRNAIEYRKVRSGLRIEVNMVQRPD